MKENSCDVPVIGSGHNGLTCGCYLIKSGEEAAPEKVGEIKKLIFPEAAN